MDVSGDTIEPTITAPQHLALLHDGGRLLLSVLAGDLNTLTPLLDLTPCGFCPHPREEGGEGGEGGGAGQASVFTTQGSSLLIPPSRPLGSKAEREPASEAAAVLLPFQQRGLRPTKHCSLRRARSWSADPAGLISKGALT